MPRARARVRNRLVGAVAVVAVAVLGAGAPAVVSSVQDLHDSQRLVDLAELNARAVSLSHSLADERDAVAEHAVKAAAGRTAGADEGSLRSQRARVDRQIGELRAESHDASGATPAYAAAEKLLNALPQVRQKALSGQGQTTEIFEAYTQAVQALGAIGEDIARGLPARADAIAPDVRALPALGRATDQASAARGRLLAALAGGGPQPQLTAAAQKASVREQAALADFEQDAGPEARERYVRTVNGTDVTAAERYLARLTDQPRLDAADLTLSQDRVRTTLTSRLALMRSVESSMATADIERLGTLRDDDVSALEIRIALLAVCLLLAVGISVGAARSMTRPLAVLRLGARRVCADPAAEAPVSFKGRDDEYAETVRYVNELHAKAGQLSRRAAELEGERTRLVGGRQRLVAEREVLQEERTALRKESAELTERLAALRTGVHGRFVNLSLRTLGLVERQLTVIESLEEREQDPERLETLFKLDHFAARMRRNSENMLVLAGAEHGTSHSGPVALLDVLRAAMSEIERYERVRIQSLPPHSQVAGFAADDISHLLAELLENATAFSPPDAHVELSGWLLESGELMLSVQDEGIGMTPDRLAELNARLADPAASAASDTLGSAEDALGLGLYVVVRLAARHGVRVQLRDQQQGGITAVVVLPAAILPTRPAPAADPAAVPGERLAPQTLPGSVAEANSNTLPIRTVRVEPGSGALVESAGPAAGAQGTGGYEAGPADPGPADAVPADALPPAAIPYPADPAQADPFVAAAERAIDAAGLGAQPLDEPEPDAYGPLSLGPYAPGTDHTGEPAPGEHTRPAAGSAGLDTPPAGRHARPQEGVRPPAGLPARRMPGTPVDAHATAADAPTGTREPSREAAGAGEQDEAPGGIRAHAHGATAPPASPSGAGTEPPADEAAGAARRAAPLPKRTPRLVPQRQAVAPRRAGGVDAEELRRRLGGFQSGARKGRRDVEAEIAGRTGEVTGQSTSHGGPSTPQQTDPQTDTDGAGAPGERHVVEEARD